MDRDIRAMHSLTLARELTAGPLSCYPGSKEGMCGSNFYGENFDRKMHHNIEEVYYIRGFRAGPMERLCEMCN